MAQETTSNDNDRSSVAQVSESADGSRISRDYEKSDGETIHVRAPILFRADFARAGFIIPQAGADEFDSQFVKEVAGAGTVAKAADLPGGGIVCANNAVTDTIIAGIDMDDINPFHSGSSTVLTGLQAEFRIAVKASSMTNQDMFVGLIGDYSETSTVLDSTERIGFFFDASLTPLCVSEDGTNSQSATSGSLFVTTVAKILRIDFSNPIDVKFYVNGVRVVSSSTYTVADIGTARLQPFVGLFNNGTAGSAATTITCTKCWIWQLRA